MSEVLNLVCIVVFDSRKPTIELAEIISFLVYSLSYTLGRCVAQKTVSLET